ncbi:DUF4276 family protein [Methylovulum psychrotolerans]|uniref:DUF4276 domain-containing protein n=1 Tax=Methylovulum psychrotolerans TaxID=1704499 RepID=A0A2S5CT98_9GAMM|nr:DUF4276 family protein [Methylovulum psychrotolerans]POZ54050.1 hypothetical protein AADEFJLK_01093 [Methylovulum psychrotolerans]
MSWVGGLKMVEVIVFAEGQSEEAFIKHIVAPTLRPAQIYLKPQLLPTSKGAEGGAVSFERLKFNARNTLRQHPQAVLTTFLDLYGLAGDFPMFHEAKRVGDVYGRLDIMEQALAAAISNHVGCRPERFIAYIQPHELEGLWFSDVGALVRTEPDWQKHLASLQKVRACFTSPEHINDGYDTKPSRRLEDILKPAYKKTRHAPLIAGHVTLATIEQECRHFKHWLDQLRGLAQA